MEKKYLYIIFFCYLIFFFGYFSLGVFFESGLLTYSIKIFMLGVSIGFGLSGFIFKVLTNKRNQELTKKKSQKQLNELKQMTKK